MESQVPEVGWGKQPFAYILPIYLEIGLLISRTLLWVEVGTGEESGYFQVRSDS
jgi:hypothetical protein